jgi:hypothetical protein
MHGLIAEVLPAAITGVVVALVSPGVAKSLIALARARARRVKHVPVSGTHLYANGVPLDEQQFREAFAAMQAELDELSPPAERNQWELMRQAHAINRFSMLAGTFPQAFPVRSNADEAWSWYQETGPYAAGGGDPQQVQAGWERPGRIPVIRRPRPELPPAP